MSEPDNVMEFGESGVPDTEYAVQKLLVRLFYCMDRKAFATVPRLFADGAEWRRPDGILRGCTEIAKFLRERDSSHTIRHVVTNVLGSSLQNGVANFVATVTVFADVGTPASPAAPLYRLGRVRDVSGEACRRESGWVLSRLAIDRVFKD